MKNKSMTALISLFARAYHYENNKVRICDDPIARKLLTDEEYNGISLNMSKGIHFFNPDFKGTDEQALRWVVDNYLSPSPLGRTAYCEKALENAYKLGVRQYLILGAGYDSFAYRQPEYAKSLKIFEIDHPLTAEDKKQRIKAAGIEIKNNVFFINADFTESDWYHNVFSDSNYCTNERSFISMLGLTYYLSEEYLTGILDILNHNTVSGSTVVFDYPDENSFTDKASERSKKQTMLTGKADEQMLCGYSYNRMQKIAEDNGFLIYEHLTPPEITTQYFLEYNINNPDHLITAFDNVNYCLLVKK